MRSNRPMSAVERFLERLLERPSARLFRTRIQPVQVRRRIERAMEQGKVSGASGPRVPDSFTVRLRPADLRRLGDGQELAIDLASEALDWARHRGYVLDARPRVALVSDARLRAADIEVEGRFTGLAPDRVGQNLRLEDQTRVFRAPSVQSPPVTLDVREPSGRGRTLVAGSSPITFGRADDNAVILADDRASRHHARLQARGGLLLLTDLDSTNGTRVNGIATHEVAVGDGDVIEIGDTVVTLNMIDET